jgi:hypothetical protein
MSAKFERFLRVKKFNSHSDGTGWFEDYIHVPTALLLRMELQIPTEEMSL